jgi:hypothetical protein
MLAVEMVWLDVLVSAGIAPAGARADLSGLIESYHEEWLVEETEAGGNPAMALVGLLRSALEDDNPTAAAWLHRAAIESMFGLAQHGTTLSFTPCLPSHWPEAELTLRRGETSVRVIFARSEASRQWQSAEKAGALRIASGERVEWASLVQGTGGAALLRLDAAPRPHSAAAASYSLQGGAPMSRE